MTVPEPGDLIDGYRIERQLGSGAMGTVWLAEHVTLGRQVALKLLAPQLADDPAFRERFAREARLAARLDHPNVVAVYDAGSGPAGLWLAMRYVDGEDLRVRLRRAAPNGLPPEQAVAIVEQVAAGLDHAHRLGLVHRDIKPANVLLERATDGADPARSAIPGVQRVLLADFGLTKELDETRDLTQTGMMLGTVDYVAPEQIEGRAVDARADIYALAAMLRVLLTGRPAFEGTTMAKLYAHVNAPPAPVAALDGTLAPFDGPLARGLAKDPAERFATAGELAQAARHALADADLAETEATVVAPTPRRPTPPAGPPTPRPRQPVAAAAAASPTVARPVRAGRAGPVAPPPGPPAGAGGGPGDPPGKDWTRYLLPGLGLAILVVVLGAIAALALGGDDDSGTRADGGDRTTTRKRTKTRTTRTATTATTPATTTAPPATTTAETPAPDPSRSIPVPGGGTISAGEPEGDSAPGTPLVGDAAAAEYVAPDGSWRTLVARPGTGWETPRRTSMSGGALLRLRQAGPGGRVILVDHTPDQAASFDTGPGVLETRTISGSAFGDVPGYRFRDQRLGDVAPCGSLTCVDVPLNVDEDGPGWGVLVAAPTASEAWATAERIVRATGPTDG